ncbi:MAG: diphthine--ammonia ligase [Nitrososphaerales archaeon]|nr:diphthine--ammonia ligase [Nitrososphaerales archaeon]
MRNVVVFWSGGKDSCLACYEATLHGLTISYLLNFTVKDRPHLHGGPESIHAQLRAIGLPFIQKETTWGMYREDVEDVINRLKKVNVSGAVFGDIHLEEHRSWIEKLCDRLGILPYFPLWNRDPIEILDTFVSKGFEAIVISTMADLFDEGWVGSRIDRNFIRDLSRLRDRIDLCGEFGEYHTFVIDGPIFRKRLMISLGKKSLKDGYWSLDISNLILKDKEF